MFSKNIKYLRLKNGLLQSELANKVGLTGAAVSRWETDENRVIPPLKTLTDLSIIFNIPVEALLTEDLERKDKEEKANETKNADRSVPIPPILYAVIKNTERTKNIALNTKGNPINPDRRHKIWKTFWRELNLYAGTNTYRNQLVEPYLIPQDLTPYCLRHEYCSELARQGVDIRIAQKLMGHSNISLTANIYTHVGDKDILSALGSTLGITP